MLDDLEVDRDYIRVRFGVHNKTCRGLYAGLMRSRRQWFLAIRMSQDVVWIPTLSILEITLKE